MKLREFVKESNRIEGILRTPSRAEMSASAAFLKLERVTVDDLCAFVKACQPGAELRSRVGLNVRVGNHYPPPGGPGVLSLLESLLAAMNGGADPYTMHRDYETLHPFTDGNGRSGRILWAWQMVQLYGDRALDLGFLHRWYYQSLANSR